MKTAMAFLAVAVTAEAFVAPSSFAGSSLAGAPTRSSSMTKMTATDPVYSTIDAMEAEVAPAGGGFWFGSAGFWGEEDYRGFVDSYKPDNLINGVYPLIDRVRATKILTTTSEAGLLSTLADAGLTLSQAEKLLPALEEAGLLSFAADNGPFLINMFGFLAVEPAKLAIPAVVSLLGTLKGLGLLNLGTIGDSAPPAAAKAAPVKAVKVANKPMAAKKAPVAAKVKAAPAPKQVAAKPRVTVSKVKVAPKPKVAAPAKVVATPVVKKVVVKAKPAPVSPPKGNLANLPKAL